MHERLRRWLGEPLVHFVLLGLAIFGLFQWFAPSTDESSPAIVVTRDMIGAEIEAFSRTWLRAPTPEEIDGLVAEYVRDEVYYREGVALGLDRDDTVIRRRLRQKMEFIAEAQGFGTDPTDAELADYLRANEARYRSDPVVTFSQVFLDPDRRGAGLQGDIAAYLERLQASDGESAPPLLGDATMLEPQLADAPLRDVAVQFGDEFAAEVAQLPLGRWQGPVPSAYGVHLVQVARRTEGRSPELDAVRDVVRRDWLDAQRRAAVERHYQALRQRYEVEIEGRDGSEPGRGMEASAK